MERVYQTAEEIEEMGDINLMLEGLAAASRKAMAIPRVKVTERIKFRKQMPEKTVEHPQPAGQVEEQQRDGNGKVFFRRITLTSLLGKNSPSI